MRSWAAPTIPELPGVGPELRIHDTATGQVRATSPGPTARMYVCGITPYDSTHMGHAMTYVTFDLVNRVWRDAGHEVRYVQNVTDIDDPLLVRAAEVGGDWQEIAATETLRFRQDMTALEVIPPTEYVGAVEAIPLVAEAVLALRTRGAVYDVDGDTYFSVTADPHFGEVSHLDPTQMRQLNAEGGGDPERPGKKEPADCRLWQTERPGEPAWHTSLGLGRPGWHIECTAIALHHLGMGFDIQGGGSDLIFPHHEMCAAQAHVLTGQWPYAQSYVHVGMVGLDGEKMSKSRGNLVFVSALRDAGVDPMAIRLALLAHSYRGEWEWTAEGLARAVSRLGDWQAAVSAPTGPPAARVLAEVRERLADDLDAPGALAAVDRWAAQAVTAAGDDPQAPTLVAQTVQALLGVRLTTGS
ncbi:MAG: cysteine--1-D-myo-inosityl 2-amino-2-deoxy-alpha-D-glucopyranoside ligase [Actinomycetes bacterium]